MARGGKRPGAGRPKGALNQKTVEQIEAVEEGGITPLDYLLSVMRDEANDVPMRIDAAHKAAPYVHAKLASVDHTSKGEAVVMPSLIQFVGVDGDEGDD